MELDRVLVDTSAYSAFMKGNPEVLAATQAASEICLSPVVIGELLVGFARGSKTRKNEQELQVFVASPRVRVVQIDEGTSSRYAVILGSLWKAGTPIPTNDIWIAASAMQHGLQVLTLDAHYSKIVQIVVYHVTALDS